MSPYNPYHLVFAFERKRKPLDFKFDKKCKCGKVIKREWMYGKPEPPSQYLHREHCKACRKERAHASAVKKMVWPMPKRKYRRMGDLS